ncbi:MAG: hypothetical protein M1827_006944 [Pycnora praestabilis]|nr:MAG: hypothetical protein M1827_006944 [Pycnora praestabilis]
MDSFQVFQDLPHIQVDENGPLKDAYACGAFGGDLEPCWNPMVPSNKAVRVLNTAVPIQSMNSIQRYLQDPERTTFAPGIFSGQYEFQGQEFDDRMEFNRPYEAQSPYPYIGRRQQCPSPVGSVADLSSSCGGSSWSPRGSEVDMRLDSIKDPITDFDIRFPYNTNFSYPDQAFLYTGYTPSFPARTSHIRSSSDSTVALCEVQQVPDDEPEQYPEDGPQYDMRMDYAPSYDHGGGTIKVASNNEHFQHHHDEGLGSSIHDEESAGVVIKDDDEASDYTPNSSTVKRTRRRSSQNSTNSPPKSPTKRRTRQRRSSNTSTSSAGKTNKVTKRIRAGHSCMQHPKKAFRNQSEYKKHIQTAHTRPFACTFSIYGCPGTFGSKNEWKRHVSSQHLQLGFWRCDIAPCNLDPDRCNDFNRKDLFTQHLRRMHMPKSASVPSSSSSSGSSASASSKKGNANKTVAGICQTASPATAAAPSEDHLEAIRQRCYVVRRQPPTRTTCGLLSCRRVFDGEGSWEERMEHVGRHLEKRSSAGRGLDGNTINVAGTDNGGVNAATQAQWVEDEDLRCWLLREGLVKGEGGGSAGCRLTGGKSARGKGEEMCLDEDADTDADADADADGDEDVEADDE